MDTEEPVSGLGMTTDQLKQVQPALNRVMRHGLSLPLSRPSSHWTLSLHRKVVVRRCDHSCPTCLPSELPDSFSPAQGLSPCSEGSGTSALDGGRKQKLASRPVCLRTCALSLSNNFLITIKNFSILFILAVLGLRCFAWAFSSCGEQGLL